MPSRVPEVDKLYQEVLSYRNGKSFRSLLSFIKKFPQYAPFNAMLLHIQRPGSRFIASAEQWYQRFGRHVVPGACPLIILQPFGPVAFVFEYYDTYGPPLPESMVMPFHSKSEVKKSVLDLFIRNLNAEGIFVSGQNYGSALAGYIQGLNHKMFLEVSGSRKVFTIEADYGIVLNKNLTTAEKFATLLHEAGHFYCGHIYHDPMKFKWLPHRFNEGLDIRQKEFEAETVCWIICERMGIENPSASYLSGYLDENGRIPEVSIDTILKAAGFIETLLQDPHPCRKELIVESKEK